MSYECSLFFLLVSNDETQSFKKDAKLPFLPMDHRNLIDHGVSYKTLFCVFDINEQKFQAIVKIDTQQWHEELGPEDMTEMGWDAIPESENPFPNYNIKLKPQKAKNKASSSQEQDHRNDDEDLNKELEIGVIKNSGRKFGFIEYEGHSYIFFPNHIPSGTEMFDFQEGDEVKFSISKEPGQVHPDNGRAGYVKPCHRDDA